MIPLTPQGYRKYIEGTIDFTTDVKIFFTPVLTDEEFDAILDGDQSIMNAKRAALHSGSPTFSFSNIQVKNEDIHFVVSSSSAVEEPWLKFTLCADIILDQDGFNLVDMDNRGFLIDVRDGQVIGYINVFSSTFTGELINSAQPLTISFQDPASGMGYCRYGILGNTGEMTGDYQSPHRVYSTNTSSPAYSNIILYRNMAKNLKFFGGSSNINLKDDLKIAVVEYLGSDDGIAMNQYSSTGSRDQRGPMLPRQLLYANVAPINEDDDALWPTVGGTSSGADIITPYIFYTTSFSLQKHDTLADLDNSSDFSVRSRGHAIGSLNYSDSHNMLVSDGDAVVADTNYSSSEPLPSPEEYVGSVTLDLRRHFLIIYADKGTSDALTDCIPLIVCGNHLNASGYLLNNWSNAHNALSRGYGAHALMNFPNLAVVSFGQSVFQKTTAEHFVGGIFGLPNAKDVYES